MRKAARNRNSRDRCGGGGVEESLPRGVQPNLAVRLRRSHLSRIAKAEFETAQTDPQRLRHLANRDRRSARPHQMFGFPNQSRIGGGRLLLQNLREIMRVRLKDQSGEKLFKVLPGMGRDSKLLAVATADDLECPLPGGFQLRTEGHEAKP